MTSSFIDFPFGFDSKGKSATTDIDDHVRDMIYQVLFTSPGERVNRPDFGCGLMQMVFMPNSDMLAAATQFLVQGSLQHWLSDVISVERVQISNEDEHLIVQVSYTRLDSGEKKQESFLSPAFGK
jgi:phage baseplate assembly protein W